MEENTFALLEPIVSPLSEQKTGVGKSGLKVRLAPDMDDDFVERLNRFCGSSLPALSSSQALK